MAAEDPATAGFPGIRFDERGLVVCIVQDADAGDVLMVAYMSADAVRLTQETGEAHFFSRSRNEIWHKGETSGNVMRVRSLRYDCDGDAVLALVEPAGPACHTGERSCFYRDIGGNASTDQDAPRADGEPEPAPFESSGRLGRTLRDRAEKRPDGSYTVELLANPGLIGEKVREEAEEVTRAAREESDERVAEEAADLLYHLEVLLVARKVPRSAVMEVLDERAR